MNPVSGIGGAAVSSELGVAVLKKLLDAGAGNALALISKCLDPNVGQHVDLRL